MDDTEIYAGELIRPNRTFTRISGADPVTPSTVSLTIKPPTGTAATPAVTQSSTSSTVTGTADYTIPAAGPYGWWALRWTITGQLVDAYEEIFYVHPRLVA